MDLEKITDASSEATPRSLGKDIVRNILVGPVLSGIWEDEKNLIETADGNRDMSTIYIIGQAAGAALGASLAFGGLANGYEEAAGWAKAGFVAYSVSTFAFGANIWGPIAGVTERVYGTYITARDHFFTGKS